jgi:hypothetical protein
MKINLTLSTGYRKLAIAIAVTWALAWSGCQSYTSELQQTQTRTDETAIIGTLRTIAAAQRAYALSNGGTYGSFMQLAEGGFLDARFASENPEVQGYVLTMQASDTKFTCNADPVAEKPDGRHFYIDSDSTIIRVNPTTAARSSDPTFQP